MRLRVARSEAPPYTGVRHRGAICRDPTILLQEPTVPKRKSDPRLVKTATVKPSMHVPLPAVLVGLGLLAAPAISEAGTAVNDNYSIAVNATLSGVNVTGNDSLTPNSTVQVFQLTSPQHGMANLSLTGALTYTPAPGFRGQDAFRYDLVNAGNSIATVFIDVGNEPVPGLAPAALAALSAGIAGLALRRRRKG
jgi:Big-like domain-containing protein